MNNPLDYSGRVVLVSDSTPAAGAGPGHYRMAGVTIERAPDGSVRTADGRLAGSSLTLDEGVRRIGKVVHEQVALYETITGEHPAPLPPDDRDQSGGDVVPMRRPR